jgi:HrpA-like RNA helicase
MFTINIDRVSPSNTALLFLIVALDMHDKNWAWTNYLSARALMQADNVREQLRRNMEKAEIELLSLDDERKLFQNIRKALVCGFFMQVAHKEGEKGNYLTVKDNQVCFVFLVTKALPYEK